MATSDSTKRVALYLRVSTGEQTTANQRRELEDVAKRARWIIVDTYEDQWRQRAQRSSRL